MSVDVTTAYLLSVKNRIKNHIEQSKELEIPGLFPTNVKYMGLSYGTEHMTKESETSLYEEDPELVDRYRSAPSLFKKIEEADDGTVTFLIWPESLWHWEKLLTEIVNEYQQAST